MMEDVLRERLLGDLIQVKDEKRIIFDSEQHTISSG